MSADTVEDTGSMQRLAAVGGVEITGIDLSNDLSPAIRQRSADLVAAHPVLVFRDRCLSKEQHYNFSLDVGEIEHRHAGRHRDSGADRRRHGAARPCSAPNRAEGDRPGLTTNGGNHARHENRLFRYFGMGIRPG